MATEDVSRLRTLALGSSGTPATAAAANDIWTRLIRHQLEIVLVFATEQREYLVMRERTDGPPPLGRRNLAVLETVFFGEWRKVVSFDAGLSSSTVAQILKAALRDMGLNCPPGRVPAALVKLAHARRRSTPRVNLHVGHIETSTDNYWVVSDDMESPLLAKLAPAQRAVLQQLLCGSSYADIAARRHTAYRTVANQVASACQRLGVSGRFSLLQRVAMFGDT